MGTSSRPSELLEIWPRHGKWAFLAALMLGACALRLIHLEADLPAWISPWSMGEYVDEGYKTLSPRNLHLFGSVRWHPLDDYPGWFGISPILSWSYYATFELFGATLALARCVTIAYFLSFLALYGWGASRRYGGVLTATGLLFLALDGGLFFYSRTALIEVPLATLMYAPLFYFARSERVSPWKSFAIALLCAPIVVFGVKLSAAIYLAPVLASLLIRSLWLTRPVRYAWLLIAGVMVASALGLLLSQVEALPWLDRVDFSVSGYFFRIFSSPLVTLSPFMTLAGLFCAVHSIAVSPRRVVESSYRTALVAIVLISPLLLGAFPYDPPRYFIPILPAQSLLVLEWLHMQGTAPGPSESGFRWRAAFAFLGFLLVWFCAARVFNQVILARLPLPMGDEPGLSDRALIAVALLPSAVLALVTWNLRQSLLAPVLVQRVVKMAVAAFFVHSFAVLGWYAWTAEYQGREIRTQLISKLAPGSTLAGDWAPFFALGTEFPALYMNRAFNSAERISELRPDYFVYSDTEDSALSLAEISNQTEVELGPPVLQGTYIGRLVMIRPLQYRSHR